jgi:HK97 family phage major capsid protein
MMNFQQIQAIRQLNAARITNAILAGSDSQKVQAQYCEHEALFERVLRNGYASLSNEQKTAIRNAMSTTTGSEGGYTAPTTVAVSIADALNRYSSVRRVATVMVTAKGENTGYPSSDGRSETGEQLGQNASSSLLDADFGSAPLNTFRYGSKVITVPIQLVQDTSIDLVGFLERRIAARLGRITNTKFTTGAGTTEPMGVATAAIVSKTGTTGQTTTVIHDDLEDLPGEPAMRLDDE